MKPESIQTTAEEDRGRETVAYHARDEEDLEEILVKSHTLEHEETAEAVEIIKGVVVDNELRRVVRKHFQAPIRSLNNPQENSVELEDGTEADQHRPKTKTLRHSRRRWFEVVQASEEAVRKTV